MKDYIKILSALAKGCKYDSGKEREIIPFILY